MFVNEGQLFDLLLPSEYRRTAVGVFFVSIDVIRAVVLNSSQSRKYTSRQVVGQQKVRLHAYIAVVPLRSTRIFFCNDTAPVGDR